MHKALFLGLLLCISSGATSQNFDLIVTTNGDSIACRIDSITNAAVYFEMKHNNRWIHTNINTDEVAAYQYNVVDSKLFVFRYGTSYIESPLPAGLDAATMHQIQRNSVYLDYVLLAISLNYERIFPLGDRAGIALSAGFLQGVAFTDETSFVGKAAFLLGGSRHFFEPGIQFMAPSDTGPFILAGYRYKAVKGFLLRVSCGINIQGSEDFYLLPGVSVGYSF